MVGGDPYSAGGYDLLKVETHLHTVHSDGRDTVKAMFEACRAAGYDAVALTDHNTVSGLSEARDIAAELGLILLPGVEITTFHGHAVLLGIEYVPEWRDLEERGMNALADEVHAAGGLLSVAHPAAVGSPICSGCAWEWPIEPGKIDLWEIFNAGRPLPEIPYQLWRRLLAAGSTAAPVAAGDVHSVTAARAPRPATYVYVRDRTAPAVLDALRQGRLFTSQSERLDFWLDHPDGTTTLVGSPASAASAFQARHAATAPRDATSTPDRALCQAGRAAAEPHGPRSTPASASADDPTSDGARTLQGVPQPPPGDHRPATDAAHPESETSDLTPTNWDPSQSPQAHQRFTADRPSAHDPTFDVTPTVHRVSLEAALVRNLTSADGRRCLYAELHTCDGMLAAISAPIWIDSST